MKRLMKFGLVGAAGTLVNTLMLYILTSYVGLHYLVSAAIATEIAIMLNFYGNHIFTFKSDNENLGKKFLSYQWISTSTVLGSIFLLWIFTNLFGGEYLLLWNLLSIGSMFLVNFTLNTRLTWKAAYLILLVPLAVSGLAIDGNDTFGNGTINATVGNISIFNTTTDNTTTDNSVNQSPNSSVNSTIISENEVFFDNTNTTTNTSTEDFNSSDGINETSGNGTNTYLIKISSDENAIIFVNGTLKGTAINGTLELRLYEGLYEFTAVKEGFTNRTMNHYVNQSDILNLRLTSRIVNGVSTSEIILFETDILYIESDFNTTWYIDSELFALSDRLEWKPGILYTSNTKNAEIISEANGTNTSWNAAVENVINPFFSGEFGASSATVYVVTNNKAVNFSSINVTIIASNGNTIHVLQPAVYGNETFWSAEITNFAEGNNVLSKIEGFDLISNSTLKFELGSERSHYRSFSVSTSSGSGGGSGGSRSRTSSPELIYAVFQKGNVAVNESQTLILDAKNFAGGIEKVSAIIRTPSGSMRNLSLEHVNGTREYGTWSVSFEGLIQGLYELESISLTGGGKYADAKYSASFYASKDSEESVLKVVYVTLDKFNVEQGTEVRLTTDIHDKQGIIEATAIIETSRGEITEVPLSHIKGTVQYGTWQGSILAREPDTTYSVKEIRLRNYSSSKVDEVKKRSFYVQYVEPEKIPEEKKGMAISDILRSPLLPTITGFSIMSILSAVFILLRRGR